MFTLSVWTGPLPLRILTVAGIVAGAPAAPKLSYASERTTVLNLTPPEFSGGGRGTTRCSAPVGPPPACWSMKTEYAPEPMLGLLTLMLTTELLATDTCVQIAGAPGVRRFTRAEQGEFFLIQSRKCYRSDRRQLSRKCIDTFQTGHFAVAITGR